MNCCMEWRESNQLEFEIWNGKNQSYGDIRECGDCRSFLDSKKRSWLKMQEQKK